LIAVLLPANVAETTADENAGNYKEKERIKQEEDRFKKSYRKKMVLGVIGIFKPPRKEQYQIAPGNWIGIEF